MNFINLIVSFFSIVSFIWITIGSIPGIILFILILGTKDKTKKAKYIKWTKICFGGIALLLITFILYFIARLISVIFGFNLT